MLLNLDSSLGLKLKWIYKYALFPYIFDNRHISCRFILFCSSLHKRQISLFMLHRIQNNIVLWKMTAQVRIIKWTTKQDRLKFRHIYFKSLNSCRIFFLCLYNIAHVEIDENDVTWSLCFHLLLLMYCIGWSAAEDL